MLAPGLEPSLVDGSFAAPTAEIACLYADDYLHAQGYSGPGVGPLPPAYPPLRGREDTLVPWRHDKHVMEQGATCACGYVGMDILDRHEPCPSCGGITIIMAETLLNFVGKPRVASPSTVTERGGDAHVEAAGQDDLELTPELELAARETMREWFLERYKDPADGVPYAEGDYYYTNGGPYDPWVVLTERFESEYPLATIEAVASDLASESGLDWVRVEDY